MMLDFHKTLDKVPIMNTIAKFLAIAFSLLASNTYGADERNWDAFSH
jgi:hypothetical protein